MCFAGVGRTQTTDVGKWLSSVVASIGMDDPFQRLLDELMHAREWLAAVPPRERRHSFSIGAFVGTRAEFALISNFHNLNGISSKTASEDLVLYRTQPRVPMVFVAGQAPFVTRQERRILLKAALRRLRPESVYSALVRVNRAVAKRVESVSPGCFTSHLFLTGEGGGQPHDIGDAPVASAASPMPAEFMPAIQELIDKQFGPGRGRLRGFAFARSEPTDEFHVAQLREKPNSPEVHNNYGAYLLEQKKDEVAAEREYRLAIALDPKHVLALGNLANLMWKREDVAQAKDLYERALAERAEPNVCFNYARFLVGTGGDRGIVQAVLDRGLAANPDDGRLLLLKAELQYVQREFEAALASFRLAREKRGDLARVEAGYACALQATRAPIGECIATYRGAIAIDPNNPALRLNLAQLLFIQGAPDEAHRELRRAIAGELDDSARLEADFYLLAHTNYDPKAVIADVRRRLSRGARLNWDVQPTIEAVLAESADKAKRLEVVAAVMAKKSNDAALAEVLENWDRSK